MNRLRIIFFFPFWVSHNLLGFNFYLYLFTPLFGLLHLLRSFAYPKSLLVMAIPFFVNALIQLGQMNFGMGIRSIIPIFILILPVAIQSFFKKDDYLRLAKGAVYLFALVYLLEVLLVDGLTLKQILPGIIIPKLEGLTGYSNFTGFTLGMIGMFFISQRKINWFIAVTALQTLSLSRASFIMTGLALLGFLINSLKIKNKNPLLYLLFMGTILSPFILLLVEWISTDSLKLKFVMFTSGRYPIQLSFLEMFLENPLGVGYQQSHKLFNQYKELGSSIVTSGKHLIPFRDIDAHSTFVQYLVEFGLLGYLFLLIGITSIFKKIVTSSFLFTWLFSCALFAQLFLYGLNEFFFFFLVAYFVPAESWTQLDLKKTRIWELISFKKPSS